jgi:hypothetical protein
MSTELFDKGFFEFEYPIWTLHDHKRAKPKSVYFVGIVLPHHGEVCPFFTHVDLAQGLLEITKTLNAAPLSVTYYTGGEGRQRLAWSGSKVCWNRPFSHPNIRRSASTGRESCRLGQTRQLLTHRSGQLE